MHFRKSMGSVLTKRIGSLSTALAIPILLLGLVGPESAAANNVMALEARKNVLVIHSYNPELSWTEQQKEGINEGFSESTHEVTVYHEFLDAKRYPSLHYQQIFLDYLRTKYQDTTLHVLMVTDDPGTNLLVKSHDEYFPELPIVFMGVNQVQEELINLPWITGVFETHSVLETIVEAKRQTGSDNLIVLGDSSSSAQAKIDELQTLASLEGGPDNLVVVNDVTPDKILETLGDYPDDWPIYLLGQLREGSQSGALINFEQTAQQLNSALPNPLYTETSMHVGQGAVGGMVLEGSYHAKQAVQLAEEILKGTPVNDIEPITQSKNQWVFDAQEVGAAGLELNNLPADSILLNLEPSFYEQYRQLVWFALTLFCLGALTILTLGHALRQQKQAEKKLRANETQLERAMKQLKEALSQLKASQFKQIQQEKMSALGNLVSGIAHEINNPIGFLNGSLDNAQDYAQDLIEHLKLYQHHYPQPEKAVQEHGADIDLDFLCGDFPKLLTSMVEANRRIKSISTSLRTFSRADTEHKVSANLHDGIDSTLLILKYRLKANENRPAIEVVKSYGNLPAIDCFPGQLNQVFMNLLANAIDVFDEAAEQSSYADCEEKSPVITVKTQLSPNKAALDILIGDNGKGMTDEVKARIFDHLFTTKDVGKGTGLGLAIAQQIVVEAHGGQLEVQSEPGRGTDFCIRLPTGVESCCDG